MGVIEPDNQFLEGLGLASTCTLVQNSRWTVVPVCNLSYDTVYLEKGTPFGEVTYADVVGRADSPEVEKAARRAAGIGILEVAATTVIEQESGVTFGGIANGAYRFICCHW